MKLILFALVACGTIISPRAYAQEMPAGKGPVVMLELSQGFNHSAGGEVRYLGGLQIAPQWTVIPGRLRLGPVAGVFYPATKFSALAGGRATLKVLEGKKLLLASTFHAHLLGEYLPVVWTYSDTWRQWAGVGVGIETSSLAGLDFKLHRDFASPSTYYGQIALVINLRFKKFPPPTDI